MTTFERLMFLGVTCLVLGMATLLGLPVWAEQSPRPGGYDEHIELVAYNPLNVVVVHASPTSSTEVIFAPAEEITQIAIGDADSWLAQPAGNLLFIKPTALKISTNMTVVTRTPVGGNRSYQFRLVGVKRDPDGRSPAIFALSFTYPDDEKASRDAERANAAERAEEQKLAYAWAIGPRNWHYVAQGSALIEPTEVSDNGRQTAFRFPMNMRIPTIYTAAPDGQETIVPYTMSGDVAVVQTVARSFTLRDGQEALRIVNQAFDPVGLNPGTGTGLPDVARGIKDRSGR